MHATLGLYLVLKSYLPNKAIYYTGNVENIRNVKFRRAYFESIYPFISLCYYGKK